MSKAAAKTNNNKLVMEIFSDMFREKTGHDFYPTVKDRVCCKRMVAAYGWMMSSQLVEKFFELVKRQHPNYRRAPLTMSCCFYNRSDLITKVTAIKETVESGEAF